MNFKLISFIAPLLSLDKEFGVLLRNRYVAPVEDFA